MSDKRQPFISVVIPVYNVEKYLDRCISTLCCQTYSNYEVILVDDGSTDKSGEICDRYQKQNDCIKVFHKANGGLSDARNYGVSQSEGEYIVFVDSDDYVSEDYVEDLYKMVQACQADMAVMRLRAVADGRKVTFVQKDVLASCRCLDAEKALEEMLYCKWGVCAMGKIYKKELVMKYPYPVGLLDEDLATTYKIVGDCKKVAVTDKEDYAWVQRSGSITHRKISVQDSLGIPFVKEQMNYIKRRYPDIYPAAQHRLAIQLVQYIPCILHGTKEDRRVFVKLQNELRPVYSSVIRNKKVKITKKIYFTTIRIGYFPAFILWKMIAFLKMGK